MLDVFGFDDVLIGSFVGLVGVLFFGWLLAGFSGWWLVFLCLAFCGLGFLGLVFRLFHGIVMVFVESLILAQDERWRRA